MKERSLHSEWTNFKFLIINKNYIKTRSAFKKFFEGNIHEAGPRHLVHLA
jgi:hypothetical protein